MIETGEPGEIGLELKATALVSDMIYVLQGPTSPPTTMWLMRIMHPGSPLWMATLPQMQVTIGPGTVFLFGAHEIDAVFILAAAADLTLRDGSGNKVTIYEWLGKPQA